MMANNSILNVDKSVIYPDLMLLLILIIRSSTNTTNISPSPLLTVRLIILIF